MGGSSKGRDTSGVGLSVIECIGRCWDDKKVYLEPLVSNFYGVMESILSTYLQHIETNVNIIATTMQTATDTNNSGNDDTTTNTHTNNSGDDNDANSRMICGMVPRLNEDVSLVTKALATTLLDRVTSTLNKHSGNTRSNNNGSNDGVNIAKAIAITTQLFNVGFPN